MTMFKKNGGFTLVELIVVIAILAILAGVAIPVYSGYITKAQDTKVITELDAIATAAQAANAKADAITAIDLADDGETLSVTTTRISDTYVADFDIYYGGSQKTAYANNVIVIKLDKAIDLTGTSYVNGATWDGVKWEAKK